MRDRPGWRSLPGRYLDQLAVSMRPATVDVADNVLRCFAGFLVTEHPDVVGFVDVRRTHVEGFKLFFAAHLTVSGAAAGDGTRSGNGSGCCARSSIGSSSGTGPTHRCGSRSSRSMCPIADDPLPRFLDDVQAARLAADRGGHGPVRSARDRAAVTDRDARRRALHARW